MSQVKGHGGPTRRCLPACRRTRGRCDRGSATWTYGHGSPAVTEQPGLAAFRGSYITYRGAGRPPFPVAAVLLLGAPSRPLPGQCRGFQVKVAGPERSPRSPGRLRRWPSSCRQEMHRGPRPPFGTGRSDCVFRLGGKFLEGDQVPCASRSFWPSPFRPRPRPLFRESKYQP